jgi:hypothetical protein
MIGTLAPTLYYQLFRQSSLAQRIEDVFTRGRVFELCESRSHFNRKLWTSLQDFIDRGPGLLVSFPASGFPMR